MFKLRVIFLCCLFNLIAAIDFTPVVSTSSGPIQGLSIEFTGTKVSHFLGIPYAKPPVGSLRLQAPEKVDPWTDVKSTINYGAACIQKSNITMSEDCLFLNVYVTESTLNSSTTRKRPVMVWIHGGSLTSGSGNDIYPGIPMVPIHDVILVTLNYRLSAFGFIYFGESEPKIPANIGFRDQILALKWVQENIAQFGGDPKQVTVFGESAGSMSVSALVLSPLTKGLFKRVILESGSIYDPVDDPSLYIHNAWIVYNRTSCVSSPGDILGCLQGLPASEIIDNESEKALIFRWYFGDDFLPYSPAEAFANGLYDDSVDLLVGAEANEFSLFMLSLNTTLFDPQNPPPLDQPTALSYLSLIFKEESLDYYRELYFGKNTNDSDLLRSQLEKAFSDTVLLCPTYIFGLHYAAKDSDQQGKVFAYYHTQKAKSSLFPACDTSSWMGVCHAGELPYVFGYPVMDPNGDKDDIKLSLEMMKIWTHFAEFGYPPSVGETEWKTLNEDESAMILNVAELGKVDRDRVQFCKKQWHGFTINGSLELFYRTDP